MSIKIINNIMNMYSYIKTMHESDIIEAIKIGNRKIKFDNDSMCDTIFRVYDNTELLYSGDVFGGLLSIETTEPNELKFYSTYSGWKSFEEVKRLHDFYVERSNISKEEYDSTFIESPVSFVDKQKIGMGMTFVTHEKGVFESEWIVYNLMDLGGIFIYNKDKTVIQLRLSNSRPLGSMLSGNLEDTVNQNMNSTCLFILNILDKCFKYKRVRNSAFFRFVDYGSIRSFSHFSYNNKSFNMKCNQCKLNDIFNGSDIKVTNLFSDRALLIEVNNENNLKDLSVSIYIEDKNVSIALDELYRIYKLNYTLLMRSSHQLMILGNDLQVAFVHCDGKMSVVFRRSLFICADNEQFLDINMTY